MTQIKVSNPPPSKLKSFLKWVFIVYLIFSGMIIIGLLGATFFASYLPVPLTNAILMFRSLFILTSLGIFILLFIAAIFKKTRWSFVLFTLGAAVAAFVAGAVYDYYKQSSAVQHVYTPSPFSDTLYDDGSYSGSYSNSYYAAPTYYAAPAMPELRDNYKHTDENTVKLVSKEPVSTFSIDVDTAAYTNVRSLLKEGYLPPVDAVRVEEMVNYFPYEYGAPTDKNKPFAIHTTLTDSPWKKGNKLLHIGIKGYELPDTVKKPLNLVLLIDTSGSMDGDDRLGLLKKGFNLLVDQLTDKDTISIVTYSGDSRVALKPTKGNKKSRIRSAIDSLNAYGSTYGAGGIKKAYQLAKDNYDENAINRILMGTDGDFNVGNTDEMSLEDFVKREKENGIYLSVLSVGRGNYNDSMTQQIAQAGNGIAYYLDSFMEAKKVLVDDISKTMFPIANDVKIQVEFNPAQVAEYRLIGYETRHLEREDFNNDTVDAGDISSGHTVTAIYELTPAGSSKRLVDDLRYGQKTAALATDTPSDEVAFVRVRYKLPDEKTALLIEQSVTGETPLDATSDDVRFSIAVAGFAQNLKNSKFKGNWSNNNIKAFAKKARGDDDYGYRSEFIQLIEAAKTAKTQQGF